MLVYEAPFIHKQKGQCAQKKIRENGNKQNKLKMSICQQKQHQWLSKVSYPMESQLLRPLKIAKNFSMKK